MVFPGVLRGRPGPRLATIHTSQPRRSLSSPWMHCPSSVAGALKQVDAVPGRFEEPFAGRPESLPSIGGAALHLGGLALCGSGVRVFVQRTPLTELRQEGFSRFPAHSEKSACDGNPRA